MLVPLLFSAAASLNAVAGPAVPVPPADSTRPAAVADSTRPGTRGPVPNHELASAYSAGLSLTSLIHAEAAVAAEVERGAFPGAALAVGRRGQVVVERGIGMTGTGEEDEPVDPDRTVYDLASLTKVVATTTAVMLLVEDRKMELDAPVSRYLPEFSGGARDRVTVRHLLTHTSGLPAWAEIWGSTPEAALGRAMRVPLQTQPGARVEYSDVGFVVLFAAAERAAREPVFRLLDRRVYGPLRMRLTTFQAGAGCGSCASTSRRHGDGFQGKVHDPIARQLGGVAGNAGLFSTAHDLARFAAMLANGGELDGVRVLNAETIRSFARRQVGTRALGWESPNRSGGGAAGLRISPNAFGHTGYTGTSIWIDPDRGTWVVLLANRTYQTEGNNRMQALRRTVNDRVAEAADAVAPALGSPD
ncbi:MAG TPA: serine hydrolase domain-containing protein [Longimicrobiaceae bacterium]|nr:serine hydrolase domain-containing protein [Longimicrobiaceae bacterium]